MSKQACVDQRGEPNGRRGAYAVAYRGRDVGALTLSTTAARKRSSVSGRALRVAVLQSDFLGGFLCAPVVRTGTSVLAVAHLGLSWSRGLKEEMSVRQRDHDGNGPMERLPQGSSSERTLRLEAVGVNSSERPTVLMGKSLRAQNADRIHVDVPPDRQVAGQQPNSKERRQIREPGRKVRAGHAQKLRKAQRGRIHRDQDAGPRTQ